MNHPCPLPQGADPSSPSSKSEDHAYNFPRKKLVLTSSAFGCTADLLPMKVPPALVLYLQWTMITLDTSREFHRSREVAIQTLSTDSSANLYPFFFLAPTTAFPPVGHGSAISNTVNLAFDLAFALTCLTG